VRTQRPDRPRHSQGATRQCSPAVSEGGGEEGGGGDGWGDSCGKVGVRRRGQSRKKGRAVEGQGGGGGEESAGTIAMREIGRGWFAAWTWRRQRGSEEGVRVLQEERRETTSGSAGPKTGSETRGEAGRLERARGRGVVECSEPRFGS